MIEGADVAKWMDEHKRTVPNRRGRPCKYDWETILDGRERVFQRGVDFDAEPKNFASHVRLAASDRGKEATTRVGRDEREGQVYVRAVVLA